MATKEKIVWTSIAIGDGNNALRTAYESERAAVAKVNELLAVAVASKYKCKPDQVRIQRKNGNKLAYSIDLSDKSKKPKKVESF